MGHLASKQTAVLLHTNAQSHFKAAKLDPDVAELVRAWQDVGAPLGLTHEMFARFLGLPQESPIAEEAFRMLDTDRNHKVDALEVLSVCIVLAHGTLDEKLDSLFSIFDFSGAGRMNFDELNILLTSLFRGLVKFCDLRPGAAPGASGDSTADDEALVATCRQAFDGHNLPYEKHISREQLRKWARHDVEASNFLRLVEGAKGPKELEALLAKREEAQVAAFLPLAGGGADVPLEALLASAEVRRAFLPEGAEGSEEAVAGLLRAMAGPDGASVTAARFADGARAWNAFTAADGEGAGRVASSRTPLLVWLWQPGDAVSPQDLVGAPARERLAALGLPTDGGEVLRDAWLEACLRQSAGAAPPKT